MPSLPLVCFGIFTLELLAVPLAATAKPNIVWIVGDDVGFSDLGFQNKAILTPVIDELARTGNVLTNFYVQSQCSPTRASFMTGRYPIHTGVQDALHMSQPIGMDLEEVTVAELLLDRGYSTHAIGKWHLGSLSHYHTPTFRGFQSFYGYYGGGEHYSSHVKGKGIDFRRDEGERCGWHCSRVPVEDVGGYSTELFTDEAVRLITDHNFDSAPLFIYLAYQAAHFPGEAPEGYFARYAGSSSMDKTHLLFAAVVSAMDEGIGKVLAALDSRGVTDNTFVLFATDNGGGLFNGGSNGALRGGKGEVWEGGTRGVAVVKDSRLSGGGKRLECLMHAVDWLPTLLSMAGKPVRPNETLRLDGVDVWPALVSGEEPGPRTEIFYGQGDERNGEDNKGIPELQFHLKIASAKRSDSAHLANTIRGSTKDGHREKVSLALQNHKAKQRLRRSKAKTMEQKVSSTALRVGDLKVVVRDTKDTKGHKAGKVMLFNLKDDPGETKDLAELLPEEVGMLLARLHEIQDSAADPERGHVKVGCPHPSRFVPVKLMTGEDALAWDPFCDAALNATAMPERDEDAPLYARGKELEQQLRHKAYRPVFLRAVKLFRW